MSDWDTEDSDDDEDEADDDVTWLNLRIHSTTST